MSKKFTPGPWANVPQGAGRPDITIRAHHQLIATVIPQENAVANARLIAAAPYLLAVMRDLLDSPNIKKCPQGLWSTADCAGYALVRAARAAITKATGE